MSTSPSPTAGLVDSANCGPGWLCELYEVGVWPPWAGEKFGMSDLKCPVLAPGMAEKLRQAEYRLWGTRKSSLKSGNDNSDTGTAATMWECGIHASAVCQRLGQVSVHAIEQHAARVKNPAVDSSTAEMYAGGVCLRRVLESCPRVYPLVLLAQASKVFWTHKPLT